MIEEEDIDPVSARTALWDTGILSWKLWEQQLPIYNKLRELPPEVDEVVVLCARQFGKSFMGVALAVEDCLRYDDVCILIVGPTLKQCREIVAPRLRRIAKDAPEDLIRPSKSEGKWFIGTSELVMAGMDTNSSAQRGKTVQNVYVEEIVDSHPDDYLESLRSDIGPALTHSKGGRIIYLTTLPKVPDHPFIIETMVKAKLNGAFYSYTIDDNKALSRAQYDACVRRSGGRHTVSFRREYLNEVVRDRSVVIVPDFAEHHISDQVKMHEHIKLQAFIDWGGVRDKTAALLMGHEFMTATDLVFDEIVWPHNTPTETIVKEFREKWGALPIQSLYADAPGQLLVDLQTSHKFPAVLPNKGDWEAGINQLANKFTTNKILIHPNCRVTIETCRSGVFNKNRTDFERTETLGHMDCVAALMYGVKTLDRASPYPAAAPAGLWQWTPLKGQANMPIAIKRFGNPSRRFV